MINFIKGDLITAFKKNDIDVLCHQENCEGLSYFKGIAKQLHDMSIGLTERHVMDCKTNCFGQSKFHKHNSQYIVNMYGQFYRGAPTNRQSKYGKIDDLLTRCQMLRGCLIMLRDEFANKDVKIAMPLIASGLASDKRLKGDLSDLEYFKKYIAPIIEDVFGDNNIFIYYL